MGFAMLPIVAFSFFFFFVFLLLFCVSRYVADEMCNQRVLPFGEMKNVAGNVVDGTFFFADGISYVAKCAM